MLQAEGANDDVDIGCKWKCTMKVSHASTFSFTDHGLVHTGANIRMSLPDRPSAVLHPSLIVPHRHSNQPFIPHHHDNASFCSCNKMSFASYLSNTIRMKSYIFSYCCTFAPHLSSHSMKRLQPRALLPTPRLPFHHFRESHFFLAYRDMLSSPLLSIQYIAPTLLDIVSKKIYCIIGMWHMVLRQS
jgi:hypothetical protein